jgi:polyhydroxyalkanoate synthesis regulator phasin
MNMKLHSLVAATLTSTFLLGYGTTAMADSTFDLVDALVKKGVLTEEEALPLLKGREADISAEEKKIKKGRLAVSDVLDSAKLYGDIRVRTEYRSGDQYNSSNDEARTRNRYKITFGVKTEADDFYTDLGFAMGGKGRSDNATFGNDNGAGTKEALYVKTAMVGWNATDWLTLEAGRVKNPLYTTQMVWDGDLTFDGLVEKVSFDFGDVNVFGNFVQSQYKGDYKDYNFKNDQVTNNILAFQGGAKFKITDDVSAKAALTYTTYTNGAETYAVSSGTAFYDNSTQYLKTIEIPAEVNFNTSGTIGYKVFGDYVYNTDGSDRCKALTASIGKTCNSGNEDTAWLLGAQIASKQDPKGKKSTKGDWTAKLWYQSVGAFSVDPNAVDSDFMDSRVNMEGVVFKGEYALRDNVFVNFAAGYGEVKEDNYNTFSQTYATQKGDIDFALDKFSLYQLDMTYKF